jgi:hypothetical protein
MTDIIVTLRLSRRAIGVAVLKAGELTLLDGRYLNQRADRTIPAALRYVEKLFRVTHATCVMVDAPGHNTPGSVTAAVFAAIQRACQEHGLPITLVDRHDVLSAFTVRSVVDRREARELARILWPELHVVTSKVEPYVADATAAAVYAECRNALSPLPS